MIPIAVILQYYEVGMCGIHKFKWDTLICQEILQEIQFHGQKEQKSYLQS